MNPVLRNGLSLLAGLLIGGALNMYLVEWGMKIIPPPTGMDPSTPEGLTKALPLMEPKHFIFPFLAHALGTMVAAYFTIIFSASKKQYLAWVVGFFFMLGGLAMVMMIPFPIWSILVDLLLCYLPMAWLVWKLAKGVKR
jgi:hypothetical protein